MLAGMERKAKSLSSDATMAYEGLEIDLTPVPSPKRRGEWKAVQYAQNG
jgi:hypothetical protein